MIILEVDVVATDQGGQLIHLDTFKMEVEDNFFSPGPEYSFSRWEHAEAHSIIGYGNIRFRIRTRPKNKPVIEDEGK